MQIPKHYDDEIGELADTINDMSVKIGQVGKDAVGVHVVGLPRAAYAAYGHLRLGRDAAVLRTIWSAETRRGMLIILREAKRLTGMVEELLEFTRMQDGRFTLNVETADLLRRV